MYLSHLYFIFLSYNLIFFYLYLKFFPNENSIRNQIFFLIIVIIFIGSFIFIVIFIVNIIIIIIMIFIILMEN